MCDYGLPGPRESHFGECLRVFLGARSKGARSRQEPRLASGIKTTVIAIESLPSTIEGQSATSAHTGGTASADKLVSPHYFEDAMLVTPFCVPDGNFDHSVA